ncbi:MAG: hypothetical protein LAT84_12040 [Balneolia bacterium]|nr:hypothetical protein [Balneolia bacterium]
MRIRYLILIALCCIIQSCGIAEELMQDEEDQPSESPAYTLIYYIHGDSDYLFHDSAGNNLQADEQILAEAKMLAEMAQTGEVFIFHQGRKPVFGSVSGKMYHFRFGERAGEQRYSPLASDDGFLGAESDLFRLHKSAVKGDEHRSFFLFFGHEIPAVPAGSYHATHEGIEVGISTFASGLSRFMSDENRFELILLSSCSNGEPAMAEALQPLARNLIASPQNLHLSYLRPLPFILLEPKPDIAAETLAQRIAEVSFNELSRSIQTTVTVSLYELDATASYISSFTETVHNSAAAGSSPPSFDKTDCGRMPLFEHDLYTNGVRTWYRPSRFGRPSEGTHSGWGCNL